MNMESEVLQVNLDDIIPNRFQPRIAFDEQGLKELSDSIREHGIIQPLVLRKLGNKFEIIAGERRYKAATMAGLVTVPAVISNIDDNKSAEVALVENIQRRDLTPIEEAKSYKNLLDKGYLTQEQLAKKMGVSQPAVANKLRLLNLDEEVQQALLAEKISERHARALLQITDKNKQKEWLNKIINERLTVRQLDQEIKNFLASENNGSDIPLVSLTPSVEEMKQQAKDIDFSATKSMEIDFTKELNNKPATFDVSPDNKFFSFQNPEPVKPEVKNNDIEVIDMPALNNEIKTIEPEVKPQVFDNTPAIDYNFSANNKFFNPIEEENKQTIKIEPKEEIVVDPMDAISFLDASSDDMMKSSVPEIETLSTTPVNESNVLDGIKVTKDAIEKLRSMGYTVTVEEAALVNGYNFNITIEKN